MGYPGPTHERALGMLWVLNLYYRRRQRALQPTRFRVAFTAIIGCQPEIDKSVSTELEYSKLPLCGTGGRILNTDICLYWYREC